MINIRSSALYLISNGSGTAAIPRPSGLIAGDTMLAFINSARGGISTAPAGWTVVGSNNLTYGFVTVYKKVADAADVAASTFNWTSSYPIGGIIYAIAESSGSIQMSTGGLTPTSSNSLAFLVGMSSDNDSDSCTFSGYSVAGGASPAFTENYDSWSGSSTYYAAMGVASALYQSAGAITSFNVTADATPDETSRFLVLVAGVNAPSIETLINPTANKLLDFAVSSDLTDNFTQNIEAGSTQTVTAGEVQFRNSVYDKQNNIRSKFLSPLINYVSLTLSENATGSATGYHMPWFSLDIVNSSGGYITDLKIGLPFSYTYNSASWDYWNSGYVYWRKGTDGDVQATAIAQRLGNIPSRGGAYHTYKLIDNKNGYCQLQIDGANFGPAFYLGASNYRLGNMFRLNPIEGWYNNEIQANLSSFQIDYDYNLPVIPPTGSTINVNAYISNTGGANATRRGFCYMVGSSGDPTVANSVAYNDGSFGVGTYAKLISGLTRNTTYRVRAYAINSAGTSYGITGSVTTDIYDSPTVTTQAATSVEATDAVLNGNATDNGGADITRRGFQIGTTSGVYTSSIYEDGTFSQGAYSLEVEGLNADTTYFVRSYAINVKGTAYGNEVSFTTPVYTPSISISTVTKIKEVSATGNGNVTHDGGATVTERGFVYSTDENPTTDDSKITIAGTTGAYTGTLSGLVAGTTYYVRAYAINSAGTGYSSQVSFQAQPAGLIIIGAEDENEQLGIWDYSTWD